MEPVMTTEPRQREKEADYEQGHEHMKGHNDPRCLKWGKGIARYIKGGYGESPLLSSEWERCPNCPPPCGGVPVAVDQLLVVGVLQGVGHLFDIGDDHWEGDYAASGVALA